MQHLLTIFHCNKLKIHKKGLKQHMNLERLHTELRALAITNAGAQNFYHERLCREKQEPAGNTVKYSGINLSHAVLLLNLQSQHSEQFHQKTKIIKHEKSYSIFIIGLSNTDKLRPDFRST